MRSSLNSLVGCICGLALMGFATCATAAPVVFSDGDPASSYAYDVHVFSRNGQDESFREYLYNDVVVPVGQTWTIGGMFGNYADAYPNAATLTPNFLIDIRTGMSGSNPGTSIYSANNVPATGTSLGYSVGGFPAYHYSADLPSPVTLTGGNTYWFAFVPISNDAYNYFAITTNHSNSVNSPLDNTSQYYDWDYISQTDNYFTQPGDFSQGLTGTGAPEPGALALILPLLIGNALRTRRTTKPA